MNVNPNQDMIPHLISHRWAAALLRVSALFGVCFTFLSAQAQPACTPRPTNLVAWWPAEGHVYDVINVREAALQNGAGYAPGKVCQAFSFDGPTEKVRIAESIRTDISRTNRWTIEAWVRPASFDNSSFPTIYSEGNKVASLGIKSGTNKLESWINNNSAARFVSTTGLANGWNHVALVRDVATRTFYINGQAAGTTNGTPLTTADSSGAAIGHVTQDETASGFLGEIDEVSIYNRALTASEIAAIHAASEAGKCYTNGGTPHFVLQPLSQTAYLGGQAEFKALAVGSPCVAYQWLFNGAPIAGATNFTVSFSNITFEDDGDYALVASSSSGVVTSAVPSAVAHLDVQFCVTVSNLVSWWPGDGSGLEVSGQHHAAVWGGVTYPDGIAGKAFAFDGTDAYVAIADAPVLSPQLEAAGELTVEAWVNLPAFPQTDAYTGQNRRTVLAKGDYGRWEYGLSISNSGVPEFFVWTPAGAVYASAIGGQLTTSNWHHLVGVLKRGQSIAIYQNGARMNENTNFAGAITNTGSPLYIGRRGDGQFLNGLVDEAAIYNRALDSNEIATLYAGGAFGKCGGASTPFPSFAVQLTPQPGDLFRNAGLAALALGTPRPDYQWLQGDVAIPGASNATLVWNNNSGTYSVAASGTTSQPGQLEMPCHQLLCGGESFELGWNGWSANNSIWQAGVPTSGPGNAHHGNSVAATILNGNYPDDRTAWLTSPLFLVPSADQLPRLRFWHWYSFSCDDYGKLFVRTNGGAWEELAYYPGHSGYVWSRPSFDLSRFAGQAIQMGLYFYSHNAYNSGCGWENPDVSAGWYLDEVVVVTGTMEQFPPNTMETFDDGLGDWCVTDGTWEIGAAVGHPGGGAKTRLNGNYYDDTSSSLISPWFDVPAAAELPRLRFEHYFSFSCDDYGQLFIRTNGGSWHSLAQYSGHSGGVWSRPCFDLADYANEKIQLRLYFYSHNAYNSGCGWENADVSTGWSIDNVVVVAQPMEQFPANVAETFEDGQGDWCVTDGTWEIGAAVGHPGGGAKTRLNGNYYDDTSSSLISPWFDVPAAAELPRLRFEHYFSFSCDDYGQLFIRTNGGSWHSLAQYSGHSGGVWSRPCFDLADYANEKIQLRLYFYSHNAYNSGCGWENADVSTGWSIDNIVVVAGQMRTLPEVFESGLGDWCVTSGTFEVGDPTSGPNKAHSGTNSAATVLRGNYLDNTSSYLVSPAFFVPPAIENPILTFHHWYSFSCDDLARVEIWNGTNADTLAEYRGSHTSWEPRVELSLAAYAGQTVQVWFYFYSHNAYNSSCGWENPDVSSGWYIDDVFVKRGDIAIAPIGNQTINEANSFGLASALEFQVAVVGANPGACLSFSLLWAPAGASINPETGIFTWAPTECQGPGVYTIPIYVVDYCNNDANDLGFVTITVMEVNEHPWLLSAEGTAHVGQTNRITLCSGDPDCPRNPIAYTLLSPGLAGATITTNGVFQWAPTLAQVGTYTNRVRMCDNGSPNYCVTNTIVVTVTDHSPYYLDIQRASPGVCRVTIIGGRTDVDYMLQAASSLCSCPCKTQWEDVLRISPTTTPFSFLVPCDGPMLFFRANEIAR